MAEINGNQRASSGSDITLSCSDGSSASNSPREFGIQCSDMFLDTKDASIAHNQLRTRWGWPLAATRGSITDESNQRDALHNDGSVEKLKSDLILLSRKAEIADLELQTLRKQLVKEAKRGQDLLKERDASKEECEKLKASLKTRNKSSYEGNPWALLEEVRQELNHEKNLNANLRLQLQKTQESNSELILAVQDLEQMLEQGNRGDLELDGRAKEGQGQRSDDDEEQKALEELVKQHSDAKEAYMLEQKIMNLCSEIEMCRRDKDELETQMEQLALDYEILKQENHDMSCKLEQSHLRQQLKLQYECSGSYATIHELENQVDKLETELDDCSNELSDSQATIKELENHSESLEDELEKRAQGFKVEMEALRLGNEELENRIKMLENELEKQSKEFSHALDTIKELEGQILSLEKERGFESDLGAITRAKMEQEQRAIRAEEALRLTRWKNANMAGRLQDEFKRLETQMQATFEENRKVATKAMKEASQLRLMNNQLKELLHNAREEIQSVKAVYEAQVSDLRKEISVKSNQMDQMSVEIEEKSNQLETRRENEDEVCRNQSAELVMLRAEIDRLKSDTASLSAQIEKGEELRAELEQAKALLKEQELLVQRTERERDNLECLVDSAKKETEKSLEELNVARCLKDENDMALKNLQSEMDTLRAHCEELRRSTLEDESEKKKLRNEMDTLRAHCEELRRSTLEDESEKKKLRKQVFQLKAELNKKDAALASMERKLKEKNERVIAAERTKTSSRHSKAEPPSRGSKEAVSLKEKVKFLEDHIKQKKTAMDASANAFLEREKDLHNKIEELERRLQEFNQSTMVYHEDDHRKVDGNAGEENGNEALANDIGEEASTINSRDDDKHDIDALLNEMASLREKNSSMETELKEMQERYSEISLKFAVVEGERQQLVMTLRNVKNATRS